MHQVTKLHRSLKANDGFTRRSANAYEKADASKSLTAWSLRRDHDRKFLVGVSSTGVWLDAKAIFGSGERSMVGDNVALAISAAGVYVGPIGETRRSCWCIL